MYACMVQNMMLNCGGTNSNFTVGKILLKNKDSSPTRSDHLTRGHLWLSSTRECERLKLTRGSVLPRHVTVPCDT